MPFALLSGGSFFSGIDVYLLVHSRYFPAEFVDAMRACFVSEQQSQLAEEFSRTVLKTLPGTRYVVLKKHPWCIYVYRYAGT